jgi:hypothetical protein
MLQSFFGAAQDFRVAIPARLERPMADGSRFEKHTVLWATPRLRPPAHCERWSQVVAIVHHQMLLARPLVHAVLRPWETKLLHTHAGHRQGDHRGRWSDLRHAPRWSPRPPLGRKSGAHEREGLTITVIVDPFRTVLLFTSAFGYFHVV